MRNLERRSEALHQLPETLQQQIETQLDMLTTYHDRVLLRYCGKVSSPPSNKAIKELQEGKERLTNDFITIYNEETIDHQTWLHILPALSQIIEYQEQLEHLDHLVDSFFNYHKDENKVAIQSTE